MPFVDYVELKDAYIGNPFNGDLSKATSSNRTTMSVPQFSYEIFLDNNGNNLYVAWSTTLQVWNSGINVYPLSTPFDITTAGTAVLYGDGSVRPYPNGCFADNGNKLFIGYGNNTTYARYNLATSFGITNLDFTSPDATFTMPADLAIMSISADGKTYLTRPGTSRSLTYGVSSTAREPSSSQIALLSSSNVMAGTFCNYGKMLMVIDGPTIKKYELGTPYDLSTLNTTPIQTQNTGMSGNPRSIYVDKKGDNIYINFNNTICRYHLV